MDPSIPRIRMRSVQGNFSDFCLKHQNQTNFAEIILAKRCDYKITEYNSHQKLLEA